MTKQIVVVGSINADLNVHVARNPVPGETVLGSGGTISAGGKGGNQAVAAALQGADVSFIGAVGSDPYARPALEYLQTSGVDLTAVSAVDDTTGLAVIAVDDNGENSIIVIPGANAHVNSVMVAAHSGLIKAAEVLLLQGEIPADGFQQAISQATGRVVVNLAPVIEVDNEALLTADPIMANEHEAGLILANLGAQIDSTDPHELATALLKTGFTSVVLTLGGKGAVVADASGITDIATPQVAVKDTTGAGDAFAGAFCAQIVSDASLIDAASHAARVGAYAVQASGTQPSYPHVNDVLPAV